MHAIGPMELLVIFLVFVLTWVIAIPFCRISKRLGYPAPWGLITILPLGTLVWACYIAFSRWPKEPPSL